MYSVIVVGTDGSATARLALEEAIELAEAGRATLHIVSAYRAGSTATVVSGTEQWEIYPRSEADSILEDAASLARQHGLRAEVHAKRMSPADAIISVAKTVKADAVVVGNKGMRGARRFALGSIPNTVAHGAPCTVVIAKTT